MNLVNAFSDMADDIDGLEASGKPAHPFEAKGLGLAPFRCLSCEPREGSHCDYCGKAIKNVYVIESADMMRSGVGSECVFKAGADIKGFKAIKSAHDSQARRAAKGRKLDKMRAEWIAANPVEQAWINANVGKIGFARSMQSALVQYGSLTVNQLDAIHKFIESAKAFEARKVERVEQQAAAILAAPVIDASRIADSFKMAKSKGLKWPKIRLAAYIFKMAGDESRNPGALYVTHVSSALYLGMVKDGKFLRSRACGDELEVEILAICNKPDEAAEAYGRLTGNCAICARPLTNAESVKRAIGPICAEKFGW